MVTKTFTITAHEDSMAKLEAFFAMLHFNGGHSSIFGIEFDGDGHDTAKFDPEPPKFPAGGKMASVGVDAEIAMGKNMCIGYMFENDRRYESRGDGEAKRQVYKDGEGWVEDESKKMADWVRRNCRFASRSTSSPAS
jgi:hypothetical protein